MAVCRKRKCPLLPRTDLSTQAGAAVFDRMSSFYQRFSRPALPDGLHGISTIRNRSHSNIVTEMKVARTLTEMPISGQRPSIPKLCLLTTISQQLVLSIHGPLDKEQS